VQKVRQIAAATGTLRKEPGQLYDASTLLAEPAGGLGATGTLKVNGYTLHGSPGCKAGASWGTTMAVYWCACLLDLSSMLSCSVGHKQVFVHPQLTYKVQLQC
jgi:hypothetical protein